MKTLAALCPLFLSLLLATTVTAADLQQEALGIKWGTELSDCKDLTKINTKNDVSYYVSKKSGQKIENMNVYRVAYGFFADRFFAVYAVVSTPEQFDEMKSRFSALYGPPTTSLRLDQTEFSWKEKDIKVKLKRNEDDGAMKLGIYYRPIAGKVNEFQQEKALERSPRFFPIEKDKKPTLFPIMEY